MPHDHPKYTYRRVLGIAHHRLVRRDVFSSGHGQDDEILDAWIVLAVSKSCRRLILLQGWCI